MFDGPNTSLLHYSHLTDDERAKLEGLDNNVANLLLTNLGSTHRAEWHGVDCGGHRVICLEVEDHTPSTVFEINEMDLAELSPSELRSEITHKFCRV